MSLGTRRAPSGADRVARAMALLRACAILALILALAGIGLPLPTRRRTMVILIDVSGSMAREDVEAAREAALRLLRGLSRRDRAAALAFAGRSLVLAEPSSPESVARMIASAELSAASTDRSADGAGGATDLAAALATAFSLADRGPGDRSVVLLSDGRSNAGSPLPGPAASRSAYPVIAVPTGAATRGVVARSLSLPELARPGDLVPARWRLDSDRARAIDYELSVDGALLRRERAELAAGPNEIELEIAAGLPGARIVELRARAAGQGARSGALSGAELPAASSGGILAVGAGSRILVVGGGLAAGARESPIAPALRAQGFEAASAGVEALPEENSGYAGYSAVVLDDVPALAMTESQQSALQDFVAGGGGLLVTGGDSSLGRGEYYATPLEAMLPVETDSRQRLFFTRSKLLFVIDHSGSMGEKVGQSSKQMAAMRGVAAAITELNPQDEVGVLGFDSTPQWILPFTPARESARIIESLSTIDEGGGTDLSQAMEEIARGFGDPEPTKRHAIILTDGLTPNADFRALATRLSALGVSVSTIGIGEEVNEELLRSLAEWAGGNYYRAELDQIPRIVDKEAVKMTRDLMQEGSISVIASADSPMIAGLGQGTGGANGGIPRIGGYLLTRAKELSTVYLEAESPRSPGKRDPLLAAWRYGNGRVAVFASDSGARWLSSWAGTSAYNRLWAQILRYIERPGRDSGLRVEVEVEGANAHFAVEAIGPDRRSLPGLRLVGRSSAARTARDGDARPPRSFALRETAPGRYEGYAPLEGAGISSFEILDPLTGSWTSAWAWSQPGKELPGLGPDRVELGRVAEASGGRIVELASLAAPPPSTRWSPSPLRRPLVVLALALFLVELFLRSAMFGQLGRARAAFVEWMARQASLAETLRRAPRSPFRIPNADEDRIEMERRMRLAEHVSRRAAARPGYSSDGSAGDGSAGDAEERGTEARNAAAGEGRDG